MKVELSDKTIEKLAEVMKWLRSTDDISLEKWKDIKMKGLSVCQELDFDIEMTKAREGATNVEL